MKTCFFKKINKTNGGFTLLISIIVTSMLLLVSFVIVNIALKQLIIAHSNQESQHAFYNAISGSECAMYWDLKNGATSAFDPTRPLPMSISCNNVNFSVGAVSTSSFNMTLPKGCVVVSVGKSIPGVTVIESKGYNNCNAGAARRFERAVKIVY